MVALVHFEHGLAAIEDVAAQQAGCLQLREHTVDGGQAHVVALLQQTAEDVFGREVALFAATDDFKYLDARQRGLQTDTAQFLILRAH